MDKDRKTGVKVKQETGKRRRNERNKHGRKIIGIKREREGR